MNKTKTQLSIEEQKLQSTIDEKKTLEKKQKQQTYNIVEKDSEIASVKARISILEKQIKDESGQQKTTEQKYRETNKQQRQQITDKNNEVRNLESQKELLEQEATRLRKDILEHENNARRTDHALGSANEALKEKQKKISILTQSDHDIREQKQLAEAKVEELEDKMEKLTAMLNQQFNAINVVGNN